MDKRMDKLAPASTMRSTESLFARAKGAIQQRVRDLIDQKCVYFVAGAEELVGNAHEVFDDDGDLFETEYD